MSDELRDLLDEAYTEETPDEEEVQASAEETAKAEAYQLKILEETKVKQQKRSQRKTVASLTELLDLTTHPSTGTPDSESTGGS